MHIYFISEYGIEETYFVRPSLCSMQCKSLITFQPKYFFKMVWYTVKKMLFKTFIFCSKVPSECVKCSFRDPRKIKTFPGGHAPGPPNKCVVTLPWGSMGPFQSEMARPLNGSQSKPELLTISLPVIPWEGRSAGFNSPGQKFQASLLVVCSIFYILFPLCFCWIGDPT